MIESNTAKIFHKQSTVANLQEAKVAKHLRISITASQGFI